MYHLNDLQLAIRIADLKSVSAAGREQGMTPAAASAALQRLEKKIDCLLFARSTRQMTLTEEGQLFIDSGRQALTLLNNASNALADNRGELQGELRIALPSDLGRNIIRPWLDEFSLRAPELNISLYFGDQMTDLISQNVHLAVRYGQLEDSGLMRRQLAMMPRVAVAAPSYIQQYGQPHQPKELVNHKTLILNRGGQPWSKWPFSSQDTDYHVELIGCKSSNDGAVIKDWALAGKGIAFKSWFDVAKEIHQGKLKRLFTEQASTKIPLQIVYLQTDYPSHKVRAVIDFLKEKCQQFTQQYPLI
ncbi:LysR family transcriptional regulator [Shewanella marinintestina]|uniref:LysR family transcriptional regulator n=1 Tax=Shewanella marinintestina TaxID=190305 RepID=UPI00200F9333|nr:LysR family transcriptional regulator [Shewanella marinintestina]MCL1145481.1 LysR family transcriptional regulator [Shewanella marinintestina]